MSPFTRRTLRPSFAGFAIRPWDAAWPVGTNRTLGTSRARLDHPVLGFLIGPDRHGSASQGAHLGAHAVLIVRRPEQRHERITHEALIQRIDHAEFAPGEFLLKGGVVGHALGP